MFKEVLALLAFVVSRLTWLCQKEQSSEIKYLQTEDKERLETEGYHLTEVWSAEKSLGYVITGKKHD